MYSTRFWLDNERDTATRPQIKPTHDPATSNHLLELQKEIKEEEEEIFADINSLINSRSNLYSSFKHEAAGLDWDDEENHPLSFGHLSNHNNQHHNNNNNSSSKNNNINTICNSHITNSDGNNDSQLRDFNNSTSDEIPYTNDTSEDLNDYQSHSADDATTNDYQNESGRITIGSDDQASQHHIHHQSHTDLHLLHQIDEIDPSLNDFVSHRPQLHNEPENESKFSPKEHHNEEFQEHDLDQQHSNHENENDYIDEQFIADCNPADQQDYQALQAVIQQVTSNLPKPCVFFLEGNCRRSDCKYSHDLSNITCKYWIEGFCFKGDLCPFLHSYNQPSDSGLYDEDGLESLSKKELNPTFVIESEADFPSLPLDAPATALHDTTKSSINAEAIATNIKNQILSSNPAVVFKTVKKKRKRG